VSQGEQLFDIEAYQKFFEEILNWSVIGRNHHNIDNLCRDHSTHAREKVDILNGLNGILKRKTALQVNTSFTISVVSARVSAIIDFFASLFEHPFEKQRVSVALSKLLDIEANPKLRRQFKNDFKNINRNKYSMQEGRKNNGWLGFELEMGKSRFRGR
jgi:hypothetical protein